MVSILAMDIRRLFGTNLRRHRLAAGLSQEAVGVRMGADRAHISSMERGAQNVTLLTLHEVAQALGSSRLRSSTQPHSLRRPKERRRGLRATLDRADRRQAF